jgi:hypothetical protein
MDQPLLLAQEQELVLERLPQQVLERERVQLLQVPFDLRKQPTD